MLSIIKPLNVHEEKIKKRFDSCSTYVVELDALRGIGALAILAYHLRPTTFSIGWTRVDLFFVISGYLITSIILKHGNCPEFLITFWVRRAVRICPAYYTLLIFTCMIAWLEEKPFEMEMWITHGCFVQGIDYYWSGMTPQFLEGAIHTWSLAIEEQFYLIWPLIFVLVGRRLLLPIAVCLIMIAVVARIQHVYPAVALARCDGLALGSILALFFVGGPRAGRWMTWLGVTLATASLAALPFLPILVPDLEFPVAGLSGCGSLSILAVSVFYFSLIGLVIRHTGHPLLAILRIPALRYLGKISYGIFLYHLIVIKVVTSCLGPRTVASDSIAAFLSILAGALSWEYLERPVNELKSRFPYKTNPVG